MKQRLAAKQLTLGSWLTMPAPSIAEMMCDAGFEWVTVDLEHSALTIGDAAALIATVSNKGKTPLCRLSSNDPVQIKRVMDAGAHGIIVPMVKNSGDVAAAYQAMHYPPQGTRGVGLARAQGYGARFDAYRAWLRDESILIAQIEHIDAIDNLDAIASSAGLDALLIGPYDLSASMGHPGDFERPAFRAALDSVHQISQKHDIPLGLHLVEPDPAALRASIARGYTLIAYSVDFRMIDVTCRAGMAVLDD